MLQSHLYPCSLSIIAHVLIYNSMSGTVVSSWFKALYHTGLSIRTIFLAYACIPCALVVFSFLWPTQPYEAPMDRFLLTVSFVVPTCLTFRLLLRSQFSDI